MMKVLFKFFAAFFCLSAALIPAQGRSRIISAASDNNVFHLYELNEWTIVLNGQWTTHPYNQDEITLDMQFSGPDGKTHVLPCFYVSGKSGRQSIWKARFAPRDAGMNSISFILRQNGSAVSELQCNAIDVKPSGSHGILHANDNWTFKYDDGTLFRGVGENICWELRDNDRKSFLKEYNDDGSRFNYDYMLHKLSSLGGNFFRMWMSANNMPIDWKTPGSKRYAPARGEFNESGMERMDYVVRLCDSLDVHIMLAMDAHGALLNHGWRNSRYNAANGGPAQTPTEFFSSAECRRWYKDKLRLLIARYGYSPAIGCWEFFNEVDNAMYSDVRIPDDIVTDWHREMSEYIKANDPYGHPVTTSISHRDVAGMNSIPTIDFNQKHIYCNTAAIPHTILDYEKVYGKPYVIGEEGYHWDWDLDFNTMVPELIHDYKYALWLGMFSPTPILPMSWWWEFFEYHGTFDYLSIVSRMNSMMMASSGGDFSCIDCAGSAESTALAVKAGKDVFVYVHNNNKSSFSAGFSVVLPAGKYNLKRFDTTTGEVSEIGSATSGPENILHLPNADLEALEDVIFIIQPD